MLENFIQQKFKLFSKLQIIATEFFSFLANDTVFYTHPYNGKVMLQCSLENFNVFILLKIPNNCSQN